MKGLGGRVADLPDNAGLSASEQVGIEDGKFKDEREVVAGHPRIAALRFEWIYRGHRVSSINSSTLFPIAH